MVKIYNTDIQEFQHITTPANPAVGANRLYTKSDDNLYKLDSAGNEVLVGETSGNFVPANSVLIDATQNEIAGVRYQSIANALVYIATQSPSNTNRWGIIVGGNNAENFTLPMYVYIFGVSKDTRLTGQINSAGGNNSETSLFGNYSNGITNCYVNNLQITGSNSIALLNCQLDQSTAMTNISASVFLQNCLITISNFDGRIIMYDSVGYMCLFQGETRCFNSTLISYSVASVSVNYKFKNCLLGGVNINLSTGIVQLEGCVGYGDNQTITLTNGTLRSYGLQNIVVNKVGGTWTNYGVAYDSTTSGLAANNTQTAIDLLAAASGSTWSPSQVVLVDPSQAESAGKRYQSIANALVYIATQTPSASNLWGIEVGGTNAENFTLPAYVSIIGTNLTALTGQVSSSDTSGAYKTSIYGCSISNLVMSGTNAISLMNCIVTSGSVTGGIIIANGLTNLVGINLSSATSVMCLRTFIGAGTTLPSGVNCSDCYMEFGTGPVLNGGKFKNCTWYFPGVTFNAGTYNIVGGSTDSANFTIPASVTMNIYGLSGNGGTITVNGGTLNSYGIPGYAVTLTSGTWNNYGDVYDNSTSGLTATKVQTAIDELAVKNVATITSSTYTANPDEIVLVDASSNAVDISLPSVANLEGKFVWIKAIDITNTARILGTIDGVTNITFSTQYESYTITSDGTSYWII